MKSKFSRRWPNRTVDNFFDNWSDNMAYVLGYFAADGCMYKNKKGSFYVTFTSTDRELIEIVKNITNVSNNIESYTNPKHTWKPRYVLQIGSKNLYKRLLELGFTPHKSLTLTFPEIPDNVIHHFIRGYFDGDGCATYAERVRKDKKNKYKEFTIRFTSGNEQFLRTIQEKLVLLAGTGNGSIYKKSGNCYDLIYSKQNVVKLYRFMYPAHELPYLKRKWKILNQGIKIMGP